MIVFFLLLMCSRAFTLFDNSQQVADSKPQIPTKEDPCLITTTEHYALKQATSIPSTMHITSSRIMEEVAGQFGYLGQITDGFQYSASHDKYYITDFFTKVYEVTDLLGEITPSDFSASKISCIPFIALKSNASFICKFNLVIKFTMQDCADLVTQIMHDLSKDKIQVQYHNLTCGNHIAKNCKQVVATASARFVTMTAKCLLIQI